MLASVVGESSSFQVASMLASALWAWSSRSAATPTKSPSRNTPTPGMPCAWLKSTFCSVAPSDGGRRILPCSMPGTVVS